MKKKFKLTDPKKAPARQVEYVKHEINKYLSRERRKPVREGSDFWDFDCKIGTDEDSAEEIHVSQINKGIDAIVAQGSEQFYLEILAKPGYRTKKADKK